MNEIVPKDCWKVIGIIEACGFPVQHHVLIIDKNCTIFNPTLRHSGLSSFDVYHFISFLQSSFSFLRSEISTVVYYNVFFQLNSHSWPIPCQESSNKTRFPGGAAVCSYGSWLSVSKECWYSRWVDAKGNRGRKGFLWLANGREVGPTCCLNIQTAEVRIQPRNWVWYTWIRTYDC